MKTFTKKILNFKKIRKITMKKNDIQNGSSKKTYRINNFNIIVKKITSSTKISIGKKHKLCAHVEIYDNADKQATLEHFNYFEECNITENLERKKGTKEMMDTLIEFLKSNTNVNKLITNDQTYINCINSKNKLYLYNLYLFKHGLPYYVYNFDFEFYENDKEDHVANLELIKEYKINKPKFASYLHKLRLLNIPNNEILINQFLDLIIDKQLATEFIKNYVASKELCYILNIFLNYMIKEIGIFPLIGISYYKNI